MSALAGTGDNLYRDMMFRRLRPILAAVLVWLFAGAARAEPPVWVVHGTNCTIVLFGSVHILPPDLNWEPRRLKQAVASAHEIWCEIPLDNASMAAASLAAEAQGLQPPGQTLSAATDPADRIRLAALAQAYAVPMEELDRLKPWLAEIRLAVASYRDLGASRDLGVEHQISVEGARPDAVQRAFETPERADRLSAGPRQPAGPDRLAGGNLRRTGGAGPAAYRRLINAWIAGDLKALNAEALVAARSRRRRPSTAPWWCNGTPAGCAPSSRG